MSLWLGGLKTDTTPQSAFASWGGPTVQKFAPGFSSSWRPPRIALDPHLTDEDVAWLNGQLNLVDVPTIRFAREIAPPPPSGGRPPADTLWIRTERIRG